MTRKELEAKIAGLQKRGIDIAVHYAYGQPRCTTMDEGTDISPRLPINQMQWWLDGFYEGLEAKRVVRLVKCADAIGDCYDLFVGERKVIAAESFTICDQVRENLSARNYDRSETSEVAQRIADAIKGN